MKRMAILAFALALPGRAFAADIEITGDQDNTTVLVVRNGDIADIADGVTIKNFTPANNPQPNVKRGGYISIDAAPNSLSIGDNVSFINITGDGSGGAIKALNGFTMGDDALFQDNQASGTGYAAGGAMYIRLSNPSSPSPQPDNPVVSIGSGATFDGNSSGVAGGAILLEYGQLEIGSGAVFSDNSSTYGGAIAILPDPSNGSAIPSASIGPGATFSGNSASVAGGAILNSGSLLLTATDVAPITFATAGDSIYLAGADSTTNILGGGALNSASSIELADGATLSIGTSALTFAGAATFSGDSNLILGIDGADSYGSIAAGSWSVASGARVSAVVATDALADGEAADFSFFRNSDGSPLVSGNNFEPLAIDNNLYGFSYDPATGAYGITRQLAAPSIAPITFLPVAMAWEKPRQSSAAALEIAARLDTLAQIDAHGYGAALASLSRNNTARDLSTARALGIAAREMAGADALAYDGIWVKTGYLSTDDADRIVAAAGVETDGLGGSRFGLGYMRGEGLQALTAYARTGGEAGFIDASAVLGRLSFSDTRAVAGVPVEEEYDARAASLDIIAGARFGMLAPFVGARYDSLSVPSREDSAGQIFEGYTSGAAYGLAGARIAADVDFMRGYVVRPEISAAYVRGIYRSRPDEIEVAVSSDSSYALPVIATGDEGVEVAASVAFVFDRASFSAAYRYESAGDYSARIGNLGAKIAF
ncbi:MAG: autotransporter outer membrane beta-barrel domain-containing protein [Rickettsiales bacterium]|nr:autotransporter outer membrane beta-barrel domain-containing protein [Rickettsiales bacterium]